MNFEHVLLFLLVCYLIAHLYNLNLNFDNWLVLYSGAFLANSSTHWVKLAQTSMETSFARIKITRY